MSWMDLRKEVDGLTPKMLKPRIAETELMKWVCSVKKGAKNMFCELGYRTTAFNVRSLETNPIARGTKTCKE